jgi:hypothetical protein
MSSSGLNGHCTVELASANLAPLIGTLGWIEAAIAIKIMIVRFFVQKLVVGKIDWNDWVMLFALLVGLTNTCLITVALQHGLGKH